MIENKTAVLLAASLQIGGITANGSKENQNNLYQFGLNMGIAFQLKDDFLDVFGDLDEFGKQIGGDIIANKKTFLYLVSQSKPSQECCCRQNGFLYLVPQTKSARKGFP